MKSIMEEGSSVLKAVEKAWNQANRPQQFQIKVFETEVKNFFGMTSKPAKIAIFFDERTASVDELKDGKPAKPKPRQRRPQRTRATAKPQRTKRSDRYEKSERTTRSPEKTSSHLQREKPRHDKEQQEKTTREQKPSNEKRWSADMVSHSRNWVKDIIGTLGHPHMPFVVEADRYYLKINFDKSLAQSPEKERELYRNLSFLLMQSVRNQFKKKFPGFKVVITSTKLPSFTKQKDAL